MIEYIKLIFIAMIISIISTPFIKKLAIKINAMDVPKDERKIHKKPIPLLGGLSIYIAFIIGIVVKAGPLESWEKGIIIGATIIIIGGVLDDIIELKPWQKLLFQLAASLCVIYHGVYIKNITNPFAGEEAFFNIGRFSIPFTILWIIGITNALNLIDGLDGLAAGVALISSITIMIIAIMCGRISTALLTSVLIGAIAGFLPYNFNPASIFMGDTGSQLLGFLLSVISLQGAIKSAATFAIVVPILALGLPIYDTLFAMVRRKINGKPIMQADKGHLHHRLLNLGFTQKQVVLVMYSISAVLGVIAILAMYISTPRSYFLLIIIVLITVFMALRHGFFKINR
ncbi:undecaprenyl/decaprenyl-phosphate alpha-N-acetylglucosaminyl 1-phosphate transferase [Clostridium algidicarnis]|uniref:MraY family glycosyltransferase n=1 Tax=Clostridium algidicarnis TaxID=37659 RepID=UPI001CF1C6A5|nr:MraY family glycosyltransferase [Clostridium algidicarnis]MCB2288044.1 undecaprenyl/decaprenyl-phosphate alpha-N-acetylglucosaminyl 1-phosphate transferase [Clostridium algidicarnis]